MSKSRYIKQHKISFIILYSFLLLFLSGCGFHQITSGSQENQAITAYRKFLETEDWHQLTSTERFPRGDSQAFYAFGDCNGDPVPELHINGGNIYHIYTYHNQKVELLADLNAFKEYSSIQPFTDGTFLTTERWEYHYDTEARSSCKTIPKEERTPLPAEGRDKYNWLSLETKGQEISIKKHYFTADLGKLPEPDQQCSLDNCSVTAAAFLKSWQNPKFYLKEFPLFPEKEWACLDALEEGNGNVSFVVEEKEQEAWKAYQEILSGDFSRIKDLWARNHVTAHYSSDPDTGRCIWRYLLMDIDHDGHDELLVRYHPDTLDYTDFQHSWGGFIIFSYEDGWINPRFMGSFDESFIPLKNGQMIYMYGYNGDWYLVVGQMKDQELVPLYALYQKHSSYSYSQDCTLQGERSSEKISQEEWEEQMEELQKELILDDEWFPASVFLPVRDVELFLVG